MESILEMRGGSRTTRQYRVRWKGYSADDDTWEPHSNLGVLPFCICILKLPLFLRFLNTKCIKLIGGRMAAGGGARAACRSRS